MTDRNVKYHQERLVDAFREEIGAILEGELADPRVGLATVTEVVRNPGGKSLTVLVALEGDEQAELDALKGLNAAKGYIRAQLVERLRLRKSPDLTFHIDRTEQYGLRVNELLGRIGKRKKREGNQGGDK